MIRLSGLFLLCLWTLGYQTAQAQAVRRPNIVIILADDLGWGDVGFHGSEIRTPNIDRLAKEGAILDQYYTAPICSPTRAGLMTGRYPNRFGLRATVVPPWSRFGVDTSEEFLPQVLARAGYKNRAAIGKWHLGQLEQKYLPLNRGFTHFYGHYNGAINYFSHKREGQLDWHNDNETSNDKGYSTDLIADEAVRCIGKYSKESAPFFLYVAFNAPHGPLMAKTEDLLEYGYDPKKGPYGNKGDGDGEGAADDDQSKRGNTPRQTYDAMVTCMDKGIGRIMAALKQAGVDDNTLILFHSDNGAAPGEGGSSGELRGTKFTEWQGGVRAPAVMRWPGVIKGGTVSHQVMGYVDINPTLRTLTGAGGAPPHPYDGMNVMPYILGAKPVDRGMYLGYGAMIYGDYKLVRAKAGNPKMTQEEDQLFLIMKDPREMTNVKAKDDNAYRQMLLRVAPYDSIQPAVSVPPFGQGRKGFKAPPDWKIND